MSIIMSSMTKQNTIFKSRRGKAVALLAIMLGVQVTIACRHCPTDAKTYRLNNCGGWCPAAVKNNWNKERFERGKDIREIPAASVKATAAPGTKTKLRKTPEEKSQAFIPIINMWQTDKEKARRRKQTSTPRSKMLKLQDRMQQQTNDMADPPMGGDTQSTSKPQTSKISRKSTLQLPGGNRKGRSRSPTRSDDGRSDTGSVSNGPSSIVSSRSSTIDGTNNSGSETDTPTEPESPIVLLESLIEIQ